VSRGWHWPCRIVPNSGGDGLPPGVCETAPGRDSQARQSSGAALLCQSIKCPYARAGAGARGDAGKACAGPRVPSSGVGPARGGAQPSSEADLVRGAWLSPRARWTLPEGA
jgi:hypothetical protein